MPQVIRWAARGLAGLLLLLALLLLTGWLLLRASLPQLDGSWPAAAEASPHPISIERDAAGIVTVMADTIDAAARGIGFAHAQDRYFQMDLARRLAAGELSELVGDAALPQDRRARVFGFRALARQVLAQASQQERAVVTAYTAGVNQGLASLTSRPWEYWALRTRPVPWRDEDSILVVYSMWWQLQYGDLARERGRLLLAARLTEIAAARPEGAAQGVDDVLRFFYAHGTEWDAPNFATRAAAQSAGAPQDPALPAPERLDLRLLAALSRPARRRDGAAESVSESTLLARLTGISDALDLHRLPGSNNFAVGGAHTASGAALIANDMHLGLRVPAIWYHLRVRIPAAGVDLNGVSLPGTGMLVAGSNGHIAWGFTNSYGDWSDIAVVSCDLAKNSYDTDAGPRTFVSHEERIVVKGGADDVLIVRQSPLGILFDSDAPSRRCLLARWLAVDPGATNLRMLALNQAQSVDEAVQLAPQIGIPQQNLVVGDRAGHVAWSLIGRVPQQSGGPSATPPLIWRDASTQPHIVDPELGLLWTANARVVDGDDEKILGNDEAEIGAGYALGARAGQIRDDLLALRKPATPDDMLRIQLDDRALFLERWRRLLMGVLDEDALHNMPQRGELRRLVEQWDARADADSVGYRLVRVFHWQTERATFEMLIRALGLEPREIPMPPQFEGALWRLVTEQPQHLLAPAQGSWRAFLLAQVDASIAWLRQDCVQLSRCVWGAQNTLQIRHPLSEQLGPLGRFLDMPRVAAAGDQDMPRVQGPAFGASERFAVSPGNENEAYLEIPGGQSAHPMSPFYRSGFDAWLRGDRQPLLPGPATHTLTLAMDSKK